MKEKNSDMEWGEELKIGLEAKEKEIEFVDCKTDKNVGEINVGVIGFGDNCSILLRDDENKRAKMLNSYKAFLACGKEVGVNSSIENVINEIAHKEGSLKPIANSDSRLFVLKRSGKIYKAWCHEFSGSRNYCDEFPGSKVSSCGFLLVDGYCDKEMKNAVVNLIDQDLISSDHVVLIKRTGEEGVVDPEGTEALSSILPKENIIDEMNLEALSGIAKKIYGEVLDEKKGGLKKKKGGLKKKKKGGLKKKKPTEDFYELKDEFRILNKVKENKGKIGGGFVSLFALEELWRRGFFSKNGTNEKSQNSENLKDLKNETKSQKGKNANSAAD